MDDKRYHTRRRSSRPRRAIDRYLHSILKQWTLRNLTITAVLLFLLMGTVVIPLLNLVFAPGWLAWTRRSTPHSHRCQTLDFLTNPDQSSITTTTNTTTPLHHALSPIPLDNSPLSHYRTPDTADTFASYTYRTHPHCNISSLHLHTPFSPLCPTRRTFLTAFSSGGRIGLDAPYIPRHCDMRWYTTPETCDILSRFEKVIFVGDSMMRHVVGAINVLLRADLGYGAVTNWNFGPEEERDCFCEHMMDVKACSVQGVYRTADVLAHDPDSFKCKKSTQKQRNKEGKMEEVVTSDVNLIIELMLKFPLDPTELSRFRGLIPRERPDRPIAFVFGHGLWNDLDLQATVNWLEGVLNAMWEGAPWLRTGNLPREEVVGDGIGDGDSNDNSATSPTNPRKKKEQKRTQPMAHILFVPPSAPGPLKPDTFILSQGDKAIQLFERSMTHLITSPGERFAGLGVEVMGTWNMSVQVSKWDGVHLGLRGNLVKGMGVVNWLGGLETELW